MLELNAFLRAQRHRLAVLAVVLLLGAGVIATHSALSEGHLGETAAMCLAVFAAGVGALALTAPAEPPTRRFAGAHLIR